MTNELGVSQGRRTAIRAGFALLAVAQGGAALWALLAPRSFYEGFPGFGRHWVSALPPFNEHLVADYGASFLALAVLAALAAILMERRVLQVAAVCWLVGSVPHLVYHLGTTDAYSTSDNLGSLVGLAVFAGIPLAVLVSLRSRAPTGAGQPVG
jgi:hypothetical protein